ncbi:hypothetical protein CEP54_015097 [Fusarium duplospermum]|uniref:Uncharacterized protein n=1 Tax=Fusarium duplospermum TaxID=1325734 RepID=A0A428NRL3_9HYPO|nr:hypothetical protein CEP54_015097 [Fusarium duplospermum]
MAKATRPRLGLNASRRRTIKQRHDRPPHQTGREKNTLNSLHAALRGRLRSRRPTCPRRVVTTKSLLCLSLLRPCQPARQSTQLFNEMLGLHQAVLNPPIDPRADIKTLRRLGVRRCTLQLVVAAESALSLSPAPTLTLERRVELIRDRCGLRECPQHERPNLTTRDALIELQRYNSLRTNYMRWAGKGFAGCVFLFSQRAYGGLHYKCPPGMNYTDPHLALLIPLYESQRALYGIGNCTPTIDLNLRTPGLSEICGSYFFWQKMRGHGPAVRCDWEFIKTYGVWSYLDQLLTSCRQATGETSELRGLSEDSLGQQLALEAVVKLRDYEELAERFQDSLFTDMTVFGFLQRMKDFPGVESEFHWTHDCWATELALYIIKCLADLGFMASIDAIRENPTRVLANIYLMRQVVALGESVSRGFETYSSLPP